MADAELKKMDIVPQSVFAQRDHDRLLRRPEVENLTGLSRSTLYDWMKRGDFPQPVKLGVRLVAWRESDIVVWLQSREPRTK
ncbi:transcriptional regulator, AlpA family [Ruegeria lacuscaerulensis ITI-1157]|nr:transcriptional regulator, AlpA family [Ruegeria lacuscaerulensis ITI-1157]